VSKPLVDVIVNNYNYGDYVGGAIDSALWQTYSEVRTIVVDDGSTDQSRDVIASHGSKVIPILKANGGQASAFNAGFEHSRGEIVIFLDADDLLVPETCARVAAAFAADGSVARVQYRMEVVDEQARPTGIVKPPPHVRLPSGDLRREALAFPFDVPWMATSGNAFRAAVLRRIFPVPEAEFRILADWYVVHLTSLLGTVVSLEEVGAYRRLHSRNQHELAEPALDLPHLRQTIASAASTRRYVEELARSLGIADERTTVTAFSDAANRMISLRLEPQSHPIPSDGLYGLIVGGVRAALRRFDVSPVMRLAFILWLIAEAFAPRALASRLAEWLLFPERRAWLNPVLVALRRG
jgi:glycosyltransferase involved in cell wall biosynthesis